MSSKCKINQRKRQCRQRNNDNGPFHQLHCGFDDLPLDPAKPFILDKIRKLNKQFSRHFCSNVYCTEWRLKISLFLLPFFPSHILSLTSIHKHSEKLQLNRSPSFHGDLDLHCYSCNRTSPEPLKSDEIENENSSQSHEIPKGIAGSLLSTANDHSG